MELSDSLLKLISSAKVDGKLSKKEKSVLLKKAVGEGIDPEEFELYLEGEFHSKKDMKTIYLILLFIPLIGGLLIAANWKDIKRSIRRSDRATLVEKKLEERGCANVQDCITKFKFEEARSYESEISCTYCDKAVLRSIISAEVSYYISNDAKDLALRSLIEYTFAGSARLECHRNGNDDYNEEATWYNSLTERVVLEFNDDPNSIKKLIYSMKPTLKFNKLISKYKNSDGEVCCSHLDECAFIENNSIKDRLMNRYNL